MQTRKIKLSTPLKIDLAELAKHIFVEPNPSKEKKITDLDFVPKVFQAARKKMQEKYQIVFGEETEAGFTTLSTPLTLRELAIILRCLPSELSGPFVTSLKDTELDISTISETERQEIDKLYEEWLALSKQMLSLTPILPLTKREVKSDSADYLEHVLLKKKFDPENEKTFESHSKHLQQIFFKPPKKEENKKEVPSPTRFSFRPIVAEMD